MKKKQARDAKPPARKVDAHAESFKAWTYKRLLDETDSTPYPLEGASMCAVGNGQWSLKVPPPTKKPEPPKPLTGQEAFEKVREIEKLHKQAAKLAGEITSCGQVKSWLEAKPPGDVSKELRAKLSATSRESLSPADKIELLKITSTPIDREIIPILCSALLAVICDAQEQLVRLANVGSVKATEMLFFTSYNGANELLKLSRNNLKLVQFIARKEGYWPVNYSPHRDAITELKKLIDALEVGTASPSRERGRWGNKPKQNQPHSHIVGSFASSMYWTLNSIYHHGTICAYLKHNPPGWPAWAIRFATLPPMSSKSASDWFACGWEALKEAAGGNVCNLENLRPVGESRANVWRRMGATIAQQESQREGQIHDRLLEAFLFRFGQ